jgi:predicted RNA-binding Zn-ribbon protein involved in translation (DUF1610 family)
MRRGTIGMKARFFCGNCGTEVSAKAERCPKCGKFFRAVTCPRCGFEGDAGAFLRGCPACGYAVDVAKLRGRRTPGGGYVSTGPPKRTFSPAFYRTAAVLLLLALAALVTVLIVISR